MAQTTLEVLKLTRDGKLDLTRAVLLGVPVLLFLAWRIAGSGVMGEDRLLDKLEAELLDDYRQGIYKQYGLYDDDPPEVLREAGFAPDELVGLEVTLDNVSFAAPLFSLSTREQVGIRFDYAIERDGEVLESARGVYLLAQRDGHTRFWPSGAFSYYLQYL